jgi:hypothetical protein
VRESTTTEAIGLRLSEIRCRTARNPSDSQFLGDRPPEVIRKKCGSVRIGDDSSGTKRPVPLNRQRLQFQSPKQLRVSSYDDGGETHCDCTDAHGQIKSPSDEKARCHRDSDKVIGGCPN